MNTLKNLIINLLPEKYSLRSYSQQAEDLAIQRFFNKDTGFFVDVGAYHPVIFSNTYLFYKKGWTGINIEPNPDSFYLFENHRKNDINLNIGISDKTDHLVYYKFNVPTINTFDKEQAEKMDKHNGYKLNGSVSIETHTLDEILTKYLKPKQTIDFMSIDVEGFDIHVLKSNDWNKFSPSMVLIEENEVYNKSAFEDIPVFSFLVNHGYILWCITGVTMIFIRKD
jgi:FkbM family methyltransferase